MNKQTSIGGQAKSGLSGVNSLWLMSVLCVVVCVSTRTAFPQDSNPVEGKVLPPSGMTIVHYFPPKVEGVHVGHVSMTLADGTYISWVPTERRLVSPAIPNRTLEEDIAGSQATPVNYLVSNLNTDEIKKWWESFQQTNKYWAASGPNCTTVVEAALTAGGARGIPSSKEVWFPKALIPALENLVAVRPSEAPSHPVPSATETVATASLSHPG